MADEAASECDDDEGRRSGERPENRSSCERGAYADDGLAGGEAIGELLPVGTERDVLDVPEDGIVVGEEEVMRRGASSKAAELRVKCFARVKSLRLG